MCERLLWRHSTVAATNAVCTYASRHRRFVQTLDTAKLCYTGYSSVKTYCVITAIIINSCHSFALPSSNAETRV